MGMRNLCNTRRKTTDFITSLNSRESRCVKIIYVNLVLLWKSQLKYIALNTGFANGLNYQLKSRKRCDEKTKRLVLRGRSLHHGKTPGCSPCILGNLFAIELRFMVSKPKFKSADKLRWEQNQNNRTLKNKEQLVMHTCSQVAVTKIFFVYERLQ